ncbi:hypothetical protein U1701_09020 [Sphingomonas sp. PB2P19]|uniref:hypothetical protein n=1 Tax=Sphingomonas rhamnosi TaxID=3096156 RepID=UPI002FC89420
MSYTMNYDSRGIGTGKTYDQISRMANDPGLYLFAVDKRDLMVERRTTLEEMARIGGRNIHIMEIRSAFAGEVDGTVCVRVAIEALPTTYESGHVVVFCTHEGLKSANLERFDEWHLVIDEALSLWDQCKLQTSISTGLLEQLFVIEPGEVASRIVPRSTLGRREFHLDTLAAPVAALHARASDGRNIVVTHLESWAELAENPAWTWWSLWSPAQLCAFQSVVILAAGFDTSLFYRLCQSIAPDVDWHPMKKVGLERSYTPRRLTIRYFAEGHHASRYRFNSVAGQAGLAKIAGYLSLRPGPRIWSCNSREHPTFSARLPHGYISPRQAGSNRYAHIDEAAFIYTSKPHEHERRILTALDVDPQAVIESREFDTIYQFIARTSVRDAASSRPVTAYVYDRVQADTLARSFADRSGLDIELELIDLGFAHDVPGRQDLSTLTPAEKAERQRVQAKERKRRQRSK